MTMHDHFPWLAAVVAWLFALSLGVYLGRLSVIHKEYLMAVRGKVRAWFDRWAPLLYSVIAVLALTGVLQGVANANQNGRDLVTNCRNANESRAAQRALWGYIIDLSAANHPQPTREQRRTIAGFRDYVNAVYAPHDCTDLSLKYPLPKPPAVIAPKHGHKP